jgi:hypothetical protein
MGQRDRGAKDAILGRQREHQILYYPLNLLRQQEEI